jgi:hypothetical protein
MHRTIVRGLAACAVVFLVIGATPAMAKNGVYVGASIGQSTLEITDFNLDLDNFDYKADTTSYKIIVGYRLFGFFAVEGSYVDFGTLSDATTDIEGVPVEVETDLKGLDVFAMGMLPLGIADLFAKLGVVSWDADYRALINDVSSFDSGSGTDMVYGIGAQVRFKGLAARLEVEFFDVAEADNLYLISLGATYTF